MNQVSASPSTHRPFFWLERLLGTYRARLLGNPHGIRTHVVPLGSAWEELRQPRPTYPGLGHLGATLLVVILATALGFAVRPYVDLADLVMVYLLGIIIVSARLGRTAAMVASILSVAALDFCFVPPRFTFAVQDARHIGTFTVMLMVGWVVANLTERIRAQARLALERERHASALNRLGSVLVVGGSRDLLRDRVEAYLEQELDLRAHLILMEPPGQLARAPEGVEPALAQWVLEHGVPAGRGTDILPGLPALCLPLAGAEHPVGVLALLPRVSGGKLEIDRGLIAVFASQIALALERARLTEERAEARLRAEEEHLRNTLLSSVSHDLRTPLGTITGATTNLLAPGPDARLEDQGMLLQTIHQEACRLQRLVNNLLDLTRLESGQVKVHKEWVPLDEVVGSAVNRMEEALADRSLELQVPELWVPLDPVLFEQVLVNLLDNALKYSPSTSPLSLSALNLGNQVEIRLSDRGPGLPPGEEERIFEKLYRGRSSGKTTGAGLGLAICRGILQAHGGSIRAENTAEGGACFQILLPIEGRPPSLEEEALP
jgi:two-component system sensor histidine kinase KdpD